MEKHLMINAKDKMITGISTMRNGMAAPAVFILARKSCQLNQEILISRRALALEAGGLHYGS